MILSVLLVLSACGVGDPTAPSATASTARAASAKAGTAKDLFGRRYCEIILLNPKSTPITAQVWNTYPLNTCPEAAWQALDPTKVAQQNHSPLAVRNGPRYWAMDSITKYSSTPLLTENIGGLEMHLDATLQLGTLSATPYVDHAVDRSTVFTYRAGSRIYELRGATGGTYVMQSWSQQDDPTLEPGSLSALRFKLRLPSGWTYSTRILRRPLRIVATTKPATVIQDSLGDTYSLES